MDELVRLTRGLLLLQVQALREPDEREKLEVVLAKAGFGHQEIAEMLGKTRAAVQKAVSRAK